MSLKDAGPEGEEALSGDLNLPEKRFYIDACFPRDGER
jgi:hypothetical protein